MVLREAICDGRLDKTFIELYRNGCDITAQRKRYLRLVEASGDRARYLFSTAGRAELGGNHTDHNHGIVLAASVNLDTIAAVTPTQCHEVEILSEGYEPVRVDLGSLEPVKEEEGHTAAIVRGIARAFQDRGFKICGFTAHTSSTVLKGSGLSSSAAIEVLIGTIFNHLFAQDQLGTTQIAQIGQWAENHYFGKPCGLMDQIACANGDIVSIDFADPENPLIRPVSFSFDDREHEHTLIVVDTGGNHADLTSEYAAIPAEMKSVAAFFGCRTLAEVDARQFHRRLAQLRSSLGNDRAILRAMHFFAETKRAYEMYRMLKRNDLLSYLNLVNESGRSSFEYLQNVYCPKDTGSQGLSLCLAICDNYLGYNGAYRVQGGGFAGTVQAYVPNEMARAFIREMESVFGKGSCTVLSIRHKPTMCVLEV